MRRIQVRVGVLIAVVFVAESVPTFGLMMDLIGGSGITLASIIFPALFYLYLLAGEKKRLAENNDFAGPVTWNE